MIGGMTLTALVLTCDASPAGLPTNLPPHFAAPRPSSKPARDPSNTGSRMLNVDEMSVITDIARKMTTMLSVVEGVHTRVLPQGMRDPDGRLGIFVVCPQPFIAPAGKPGMNAQKSWVMLAVFAAVKYTADSPVAVDYVGLADARGMTEDRWYYKLNMSAARQVQRQLFAGTISLEQGYDKIAAAWRRVTPAG